MTTNNSESKKKFRIAHNLEDLEDQLILTLKDKPILKDNKQINQQEDLFENEQIQNQNKMKYNSELKKKIKQLSDVTTSHLQTKYQGKGGILPHYDDHSYKTGEIEVEQNGIIKVKKPKTIFKNTQSDFLTNQDEKKTTKLGSQYSTVRIKKSLNKNQSTSAKNTSDLLDFLNETAQDNIVEDNLQNKNAQELIENTLDTLRKKRILQYNAKREISSVDISSIIRVSQQDQMLNRAMSRARKGNYHNKNVLEIIKEEENNSDQQDHRQIKNKNDENKRTVEIELNPISYRGDDKKYVRKQLDMSGIKSGTTSAMFIKLPSERLPKKEEKEELPDSFKDITPEELQKMKQEISFLQDKALGTGLSGALQYLRENSLIGKEQQAGRSTDKSGLGINDPNDRIKLQYRNANGKLMKPKQAFRYLCAKFHGQGPGKNKIEKRKKKELEEMRMKERSNMDGQLMGLLGEYQKKNNEAYMVIEMGKKAAGGQI